MRRVLASPYLALLLTAAIWGSLHPVGKLALRDVQPLQLILTRVIFAGLTVFILLALQGKAGELRRELRSRPGTMAVLGFLSFFGSSGASMSALALLPASVSSLLSNVSPLFVALGVIAIERRRTPPGVILGVVIGFAGLVVVVLGEDAPGVGSMALQPIGVGLALLGSLSWALYIGASRRAMAKGHPLAVVAASSLFGGLPWAILALANGAFLELFRLPPTVWALLLYTGIVGTGLTYGLWTAALRRLSAASVAVFQYAIPFFAVILAVVLLGERITMPLIVGGVGIIAGIAITQHAARSQSRRPGRDAASCRT
ncbi:MAG TPA: DMT family transporter [Chloroflexota bacterium]|nr:DMT family transporter [Chloroflexota bacterium]